MVLCSRGWRQHGRARRDRAKDDSPVAGAVGLGGDARAREEVLVLTTGARLTVNLQVCRQAVLDIRRAVHWLNRRGYERIGILGTSLGYFNGRAVLSGQLSLEPSVSLNWLDLPQEQFLTRLFALRSTFASRQPDRDARQGSTSLIPRATRLLRCTGPGWGARRGSETPPGRRRPVRTRSRAIRQPGVTCGYPSPRRAAR